MGNFICDNYYCQSISFKPEWLSESTWNITYNYEKEEEKPYIIDKGILKMHNIIKFDLLLSKKLLIDFNEIRNISIPINFKYNLSNTNNLDIFVIFSNSVLLIDNINELIPSNNLFFIHMSIFKKKITIYRSFNDKVITKKINPKKINTFIITVENNFNILLITEKIFNNLNNIYEEKYLNMHNFDNYNELYLNLYIKNENGLIKKEFVELNFE